MTKHAHSAAPLQTVWSNICAEAQLMKAKEPALAALVQNSILAEDNILSALARIVSEKLSVASVPAEALFEVFTSFYRLSPHMEEWVQYDLLSILKNDPAAYDTITPF